MRILNISAQKPDSTGSGTYLAQTVCAQQVLGNQTAVVCGLDNEDVIHTLPAETKVFPVRFMTEDLPFHVCGMSDQMPYPSTRYRDLTPEMTHQFETAFATAITRAIAQFKPDIIVCHHLYLVCALAVECAGAIPVVAICHSTDMRQLKTHALERGRIIKAMHQLRMVFALHMAQASQIAELYALDQSKIQLLGVGFDSSCFYRQEKYAAEKNASLEALRGDVRADREARKSASVVFVGKVNVKKGVLALLHAVRLLECEARAPEALRLTLVGGHDETTPDYQEILAAADGLACSVTFTGKLAPQELARVYRASDLFVLPSYFEGLPLVAIEALACGCKVLMSDLPGVREGFESMLPQNPIAYVELPAMESIDTPVAQEVPAFERRLAESIMDQLKTTAQPYDCSGASWQALTERMVGQLAQVVAHAS